MSADEKLYEVLAPAASTAIPWDRAAEAFVMIKAASGGLVTADVEELEKVARGLTVDVSPDEAQGASRRASSRGSAARALVTSPLLRASAVSVASVSARVSARVLARCSVLCWPVRAERRRALVAQRSAARSATWPARALEKRLTAHA